MIKKKWLYHFANGFLSLIFSLFEDVIQQLSTTGFQNRWQQGSLLYFDVSMWVSEETYKHKPRLGKHGEIITIYPIVEGYEASLKNWVEKLFLISLDSLDDSLGENHEKAISLYYLLCKWMLEMLTTFEQFVMKLEDREILEGFLEINQKFEAFKQWLQDEMHFISECFQENRILLEPTINHLFDQFIDAWQKDILSATEQYLISTK